MSKGNANSNPRPKVDHRWFWEFDVDKIDWRKGYKTIIARILERGTDDEWRELELFYGKREVINAIQHEIVFLPDYVVDKVCRVYDLKRESLLCYIRKERRSKQIS